jgi:hypothetical protein
MPPELLTVFPQQRDTAARKGFYEADAIEQRFGGDYKTYPMLEQATVIHFLLKSNTFGQKHTLVEFSMICFEWVHAYAKNEQPKMSIFSLDKARHFLRRSLFLVSVYFTSGFCSTLDEGLLKQLFKMRIRIMPCMDQITALNQFLSKGFVKASKKAELNNEPKAVISSQKSQKFGLKDVMRITSWKRETPLFQVLLEAIQTEEPGADAQAMQDRLNEFHWPAWLGFHFLLTKADLSSRRAAFNTERNVLAPLYKSPEAFTKAVVHWQYLFCAGDPDTLKSKDSLLQVL